MEKTVFMERLGLLQAFYAYHETQIFMVSLCWVLFYTQQKSNSFPFVKQVYALSHFALVVQRLARDIFDEVNRIPKIRIV